MQAFEFVFEGQPLAGFFFVGLLHEFAEAVDAFVERGEDLVQLVAVLFGEAAAFFFQYRVGKVLKLLAQTLAGFGEELEFFVGGEALLLKSGVEAFVVHLQGLRGLLQIGVILFQTACLGFTLLQIGDLAFGGGEAVAQFLQFDLQILNMAAAVGQGFFGGFLRLAGEAVLLGTFGKLLFQQVLPPLGTYLHDKPGNQGAEQGGTRGDNGQGGKVHNTGRLKNIGRQTISCFRRPFYRRKGRRLWRHRRSNRRAGSAAERIVESGKSCLLISFCI